MAKVSVCTYHQMPHESFRHSVSINDNYSDSFYYKQPHDLLVQQPQAVPSEAA